MTHISILITAERDGEPLTRREIDRVGSDAEANEAIREAVAFTRRPTRPEARMASDLDVYRTARRRLVGSCLSVIADIIRKAHPDANTVTVNFADGQDPELVSVGMDDGIDHDASVLNSTLRLDLLADPLARLREAAETSRNGAASFRLPPSPPTQDR